METLLRNLLRDSSLMAKERHWGELGASIDEPISIFSHFLRVF